MPRLPSLTLRSVLTLGLLAALAFASAALTKAIADVDTWTLARPLLLAALLSFLAAPFLLDITLRWFYVVSRRSLDEIPPHLSAFIQRTCKTHSMTPPRIYVIADGTPTAFTYGWSPSTARVVFSQGLLELLSPLEAEAVVGHELGHAKSWDILIASVASFTSVLIEVLATLIATALGGSDDGERGAPDRFVQWAARGLSFVAQLIELSLSRTRELHADRFGARACGSAAAMGRALIKISYGLTSKAPRRHRGFSPSLQVQATGSARGLVISGSSSPDNINHVQAKAAMAWDLWNPWARVHELVSTHPTTARRLVHLQALSEAMDEPPVVHFNLPKPRSYLGSFVLDVLVHTAPTAAMFSMPWLEARWGLQGVGAGFLLIGILLSGKFLYKYRGRSFPDTTVAELMAVVNVSTVRPVPCRLTGHSIGRGTAGLVWSEDFTFQDETGIVLVDHRQPLALWEFLWGLFRSSYLVAGDIIVEGWFRRGPIPYVEVRRFWHNGTPHRSYFRWLHIGLAALSVGAGVVMLLDVHTSVISWVRGLY